MPGTIDAIHAVRERLKREKGLPLVSVSLTPVLAKDVHALEATRGNASKGQEIQQVG